MITFEVEENTPVIEQGSELIESLVTEYHKKPTPYWESYHDGFQAGIRYALLALNVKIDGINKREGGHGNEKR